MSKDIVQNHLATDQHKEARKLTVKSELGAVPYHETVVSNSPIRSAFKRMHEKDKKNLRTKFNTAYYLAKRERPFSDYPSLLELQTKNHVPDFGSSYLNDRAAAKFTKVIASVEKDKLAESISKARYYSILNDGSTDSSVNEKELVYILFLDEGTLTVKYLSIESVKSADAVGIHDSIIEAFNRFGITSFEEKLVGLNVDGASVNTGKHKGLGARIKEIAPWLDVVHCFNHRLELSIKDALEKIPNFQTINEFLLKLYYLYQKSPKRLRCLHELEEEEGKSAQKPTKVGGT